MRVRPLHGDHRWVRRRRRADRAAGGALRPVASALRSKAGADQGLISPGRSGSSPRTATTLIDALATYRLTRLVTEDQATAGLRRRIDAWANRNRDWEGDPGPEPKLSYFLTCPWCVSIWIAAGVVAARRIAPRAWAPAADLLALSAATGITASTIAAMRAPADSRTPRK